jgi:hypothetical protein
MFAGNLTFGLFSLHVLILRGSTQVFKLSHRTISSFQTKS